ncbi:MAG: alpha/beta hydrolase [Clostridiales bacterium]|nr:alpha/beta hydrolase [Clostridiales bacterium]
MSLGFSYIGLIMLLMLFVPNAIWTKNQPKDYDKYAASENKVLQAFERVGQFIVTPAALIFSDFNPKAWNFWCWVLILALLNLLVYDIAWVRYFKSEKTMKDFYKGFLGMPLAFATYPVIAFFLLGIFGGNIIMVIGSVLLGIGHIGIHVQHAKEVYGARKKRPIVVRILKWIGVAVLVLILGFVAVCIAGRNYHQVKRAIEYRDGIDETIYVELNGQEQYLWIAGHDTSNPVIISLHGGPGAPTSFIDYCWIDELTDNYTVVSWDNRGCGRTYFRNIDSDPDNETVNFEQAQEDLDALVDYLCDRFGQDQVIILGHSYGSLLGSQYVTKHPEKVAAYIGVGQVVHERGYYGEIYSYEDALARAKEAGDDTSEMEAAFDAFMDDMGLKNLMALRNAVAPYHPQKVTTDVSTWAGITSPYLGVDDARWYLTEMTFLLGSDRYERLISGLEVILDDFDFYDYTLDYQVPVLFISGSDDWICPSDFVEEYCEDITAPRKKINLMEGCGHSPQGQLPAEFGDLVEAFLQ